MKTWILSGVGVLVLGSYAQGCSSSSSGTTGGGNDAGTDSSSGSGSGSGGGSGSGSGGGSGSGSGGSSGGSSGSSSGGSSTGGVETTLATGLSSVSSLIEVGSNLFWVDVNSNKLMSEPITGGTPTAVVSMPITGTLNGQLATDGTLLYFAETQFNATTMYSSSPTGTNQQAVAAGFTLNTFYGSPGMFYVAGNLYVLGSSPGGILQIPTNGSEADGGMMPNVIEPAQGAGSFNLGSILWIDASGVYWNYADGSISGETDYAPLATGTPSTLVTVTGNTQYLPGSLAVVGGTAYFMGTTIMAGMTATYTATLYKSAAGAMGSMVATYANQQPGAFVADASGAYAVMGGGSPGIYSINLSTGAQTLFDMSTAAQTASPQNAALLDAKNLYYVSGQAQGPFSLIAVTR